MHRRIRAGFQATSTSILTCMAAGTVSAVEAIAATDGLGYRIFLVRRYMAMDIILPYVVWITLLAFMMDLLLRMLSSKAFPWYQKP